MAWKNQFPSLYPAYSSNSDSVIIIAKDRAVCRCAVCYCYICGISLHAFSSCAGRENSGCTLFDFGDKALNRNEIEYKMTMRLLLTATFLNFKNKQEEIHGIYKSDERKY